MLVCVANLSLTAVSYIAFNLDATSKMPVSISCELVGSGMPAITIAFLAAWAISDDDVL